MLNKIADELMLPLLQERLPEFVNGVDSEAEAIILTQDAFGPDPDEVGLMGTAIKYAGIKGKEVRVLPYNFDNE